MSSRYAEIRSSIETYLSNTTGLPDIAWENVTYKPETFTPFIKFYFQPTSRRPSTVGIVPNNRYQGICTLLLHYPSTLGPGASQATVDKLIDRFEAYTDINSDIRIEYSQQESQYVNQPWFITPVRIGWYTYD